MMNTKEAIRTRRSVGKMKPDRPPREVIAELLEHAVWAPTHRLLEPWRFHVIAGEERIKLGAVLEAELRTEGETSPEALAKERDKPLTAPVIVIFTSKPNDDEILNWENQLATAAAIQNFTLAAHDAGIATFWRTGITAYSPSVADYLGLEQGERVIGAVYVGYRDMHDRVSKRTPAAEFTDWRGWN
jgi:nitroreductase